MQKILVQNAQQQLLVHFWVYMVRFWSSVARLGINVDNVIIWLDWQLWPNWTNVATLAFVHISMGQKNKGKVTIKFGIYAF